MTKPRFSIVIPTRQRHRSLFSAIQSVLGQPYEDFELIVQDNFSSEETWKTVRGFNSPKLRYNRAPYLLPMNDPARPWIYFPNRWGPCDSIVKRYSPSRAVT